MHNINISSREFSRNRIIMRRRTVGQDRRKCKETFLHLVMMLPMSRLCQCCPYPGCTDVAHATLTLPMSPPPPVLMLSMPHPGCPVFLTNFWHQLFWEQFFWDQLFWNQIFLGPNFFETKFFGGQAFLRTIF